MPRPDSMAPMAAAAPVVTIREAVVDDVPLLHASIAAIAEAVGEAGQVISTEADLRRFGFGAQPAFQAAVAEADGAFAGMCLHFPVFSTWLGRPGVYVQDLHVGERFRGIGVGGGVRRPVTGLSRPGRGTYMRLSVDEKNHRAQAFYGRLGLVWSRQERSFIAQDRAFVSLSEKAPRHRDPEERP